MRADVAQQMQCFVVGCLIVGSFLGGRAEPIETRAVAEQSSRTVTMFVGGNRETTEQVIYIYITLCVHVSVQCYASVYYCMFSFV